MRVLNLYAGIGGNRKLWKDVCVTAVEKEKSIAKIYSSFFPNDKVIIGDAHKYLLQHYDEFDFVWSSPPCPSHSKMRLIGTKRNQYDAIYPDMQLYQEIIFLSSYCKGKYVVENVFPFYEPLIRPRKIVGRHCFWSNFNIGFFDTTPLNIKESNVKDLQKMHGFDLSPFDVDDKLKILRNCVAPETGLYILNCARNIMASKNKKQTIFTYE